MRVCVHVYRVYAGGKSLKSTVLHMCVCVDFFPSYTHMHTHTHTQSETHTTKVSIYEACHHRRVLPPTHTHMHTYIHTHSRKHTPHKHQGTKNCIITPFSSQHTHTLGNTHSIQTQTYQEFHHLRVLHSLNRLLPGVVDCLLPRRRRVRWCLFEPEPHRNGKHKEPYG